MAPAVATAPDQATDLLHKLSLNPKGDARDAKEVKKVSPALNGGLNGMVASPNPQVASAEQWATVGPQDYKDAGMYYGAGAYPYYYGGWGDYSVYVSHDGSESLTPGVYGDMYGYPQYGVAASGHDGQIYGSQHYQYPSTYQQPQTNASKPAYKSKMSKPAPSAQEDVSAVAAADPQPGLVGASIASSNNTDGVKGLNKAAVPLKPNWRSGSYQNQGGKAPYSWSSGRTFSEKQQRLSNGNPTSTTSNPKTKGLLGQNSPMSQPSAGYMSSIYSSNGMYNANAYGPGLWYGSHLYGPGLYGGWNAMSDGKYKPRGKTYGSYGFGNENIDGLNELKRGPRSGLFKNEQGFGATAVTTGKGEELPTSDGSNTVVRDQYNQADFAETYSDAKFFVIKSYSEDDVHKSIKYNVWASTPSGNKKLDTAYQAAKEKSSNSPVFLLFSVNTTGQFVGLAEMVGQVDFNKTVEYWQQDKWTGCFPVKWHIVKDIPNNILKHIILEYNENKPVTNSRDTQEVKLEEGLQVLKIFKDHVCKTSMLDDFGFYDNREKILQEKKSKRQHPQDKIMNRKLITTGSTENEDTNGKPGSQELGLVGEQNVVVENGGKTDVVENGGKTDVVENGGKTDVVENGGKTDVVESGGQNDLENGVAAVAVNAVAPTDESLSVVANGH